MIMASWIFYEGTLFGWEDVMLRYLIFIKFARNKKVSFGYVNMEIYILTSIQKNYMRILKKHTQKIILLL